MEDKKIIQLFWERSEDAIKETEMKFSSYLHTIAHNVLRDREDARECVCDTYLCAWKDIPPSYPDNLKAYLSKITRNLAISHLRQKTSLKRGKNVTLISISELDECIPGRYSVDEKVDEAFLKEVLNEFLESLPEEKRMLFMKRYWFCYSVKEIAGQLGVKEKYVTNVLYQTRRKLKEFLEKRGYEQ